jgi:hypothetical protein
VAFFASPRVRERLRTRLVSPFLEKCSADLTVTCQISLCGAWSAARVVLWFIQ